MGESLLISVREGFEAALVVAIVMAFVRRSDRPDHARFVWYGTAAALAVAALVGLALHIVLGGLDGVAEERSFAVVCTLAAALLTWMIFWMRSHARSIKGDLEARAGNALTSAGGWALAGVAFLAVVREGLETSLFLLSTTAASGGGQVVAGTLIGLAVAVVLGVAIYKGSHRLDLRRFFLVTGVLVVFFAAGLLARSVMFLQSSGDLGSFDLNGVYDLRRYPALTLQTQSGRFLAGIFGWDPRPSIEQVVVYLAYLAPVLILFLRPGARPAPAPVPAPVPTSARVPAGTAPTRTT